MLFTTCARKRGSGVEPTGTLQVVRVGCWTSSHFNHHRSSQVVKPAEQAESPADKHTHTHPSGHCRKRETTRRPFSPTTNCRGDLESPAGSPNKGGRRLQEKHRTFFPTTTHSPLQRPVTLPAASKPLRLLLRPHRATLKNTTHGGPGPAATAACV